MPNKGTHLGVRLSEEGLKKVHWRLDIRAWLPADWAAKADVHPKTVYAWLNGGYATHTTAAKLQQAFLDYPPIEGLAELLEREVAV